MAKQVGPTYLLGTTGDVNGYLMAGEAYARLKPGPKKGTWARKPTMAPSRLRAAEFGGIAHAGHWLWKPMRKVTRQLGDRYAYNRLVQVLYGKITRPADGEGGRPVQTIRGRDLVRGLNWVDLSREGMLPEGVRVLREDQGAHLPWEGDDLGGGLQSWSWLAMEGLGCLKDYLPGLKWEGLKVRVHLHIGALPDYTMDTQGRYMMVGAHDAWGHVGEWMDVYRADGEVALDRIEVKVPEGREVLGKLGGALKAVRGLPAVVFLGIEFCAPAASGRGRPRGLGFLNKLWMAGVKWEREASKDLAERLSVLRGAKVGPADARGTWMDLGGGRLAVGPFCIIARPCGNSPPVYLV